MKKIQPIVQTVLIGAIVLSLTLACWFHTPQAYSVSERSELAQFPSWSSESVLSGKFMEEFEEYAADQFPLRDTFRAWKALVANKVFLQSDNNDVYEAFGHLSEMEYPESTDSFTHAKDTIDRIVASYLNDSNRVYLSLIPDKNAFMAEASGHLSLDYDAFYQKWRDYCGERGLQYIDIAPLLELSDYYSTDTHWKQECIVDVAQTLTQAMGTTIPTDYVTHTVEAPFYGVYSGRYALPYAADTIRYVTNDVMDGMTASERIDLENSKEMPLYSLEKTTRHDPYEMYLSGPLSLVTVENPNADTDKSLIVFRDSFGSSIAPLLAQGYKSVTLVDIRYLSSRTLDKFVDFEGCDVLFLYSTMVLNSCKDTFK